MIAVWTVCWRAPEENHNDMAMITLYQLKRNANARLTNMAASDALPRGHSVCWNEPATGPLGVNISSCIFRSLEMWFEVTIFIKPQKTFHFFPREFLSFIEINFDFHWVGRGRMRDYFRSWSTMRLPSTEYNFHQHMPHHNTSFINQSRPGVSRSSPR